MRIRSVLLILWAIVCAALLYYGVHDTLRWRGDAEAVRMGLGWTDSYLPHGIVALIVAIGLLVKQRVGLWTSLGCAIVFGLYYVAYLVFGGEGVFYLRIGIPVLFLALVAATLRFIRHAMTTPIRGEETKGTDHE